MTITDTLLENVAKALNSESYDVISHMAVTSDAAFSADTDNVNIGTELGSRTATGNTRIGTTVTFSTIRVGASIINTSDGDTLTGVGYFQGASGDGLHVNVALPSVNQTTGFDIEFDMELTTNRR